MQNRNERIGSVRFFAWPNILAIDAALIAVAWQRTFAAISKSEVSASASMVLAISVWLTYMADRLLDVSGRSPHALASARHQFAKRRWAVLSQLWFAALGANVLVAWLGLNAGQLRSGGILLVACLLYTGLNQALSRYFFPKEVCVAMIFAGGAVVFLDPVPSFAAVAVFAILCLINCLAIAFREASLDARMKIRSLTFLLRAESLYVLLLVALAGTIFDPTYALPVMPTLFALGVLIVLAPKIEAENFRVLADLALFTGPVAYFLAGLLVR